MLLRQNDSKVTYSCEINLYFEDGSEKHLEIKEANKINVVYKQDAETHIDTGIISKIIPISVSQDCAYGCACSSCTSNAIIVLDVSKDYNSEVKKIRISDILDIDIIDTYETTIKANPNNLKDIIANSSYGEVIELQPGVYNTDDNFIIDKSVIIKGINNTALFNGSIEVIAPDVVIMDCAFISTESFPAGSGSNIIKAYTDGSFTFIRNIINYTGNNCRTGLMINAKKPVIINNNVFFNNNTKMYNWIEVGLDKDHPIANGSKFNDNQFYGKIAHNHISLYTFENNSDIQMNRNIYEYSCNGIRLSNTTSATVNITIDKNKYVYTDESDNYTYAGLLLLQDYSPEGEIMDFSKMNILISDLIGPNEEKMLVNKPNTIEQIYYVYDDQDGITTRNNPNIKIL